MTCHLDMELLAIAHPCLALLLLSDGKLVANWACGKMWENLAYTHSATSHSALSAQSVCQAGTRIWTVPRRHDTVICFSRSLPGCEQNVRPSGCTVWQNVVTESRTHLSTVCVGATVFINKRMTLGPFNYDWKHFQQSGSWFCSSYAYVVLHNMYLCVFKYMQLLVYNEHL